MGTQCQMEILNFLWLNWVQYLPFSSHIFTRQNHEFESTLYTRINVYTRLFGSIEYIIANRNFDFLDIYGEDKLIKKSGTRTRTVDNDLGELW